MAICQHWKNIDKSTMKCRIPSFPTATRAGFAIIQFNWRVRSWMLYISLAVSADVCLSYVYT